MEYVSCFLLAFREAKKYQLAWHDDMLHTHVECWHNNNNSNNNKSSKKNGKKHSKSGVLWKIWTFLAQFGPLKVRLSCSQNQNVIWPILPGGFGRGVSQLPRNPRVSPAARRGNQHWKLKVTSTNPSCFFVFFWDITRGYTYMINIYIHIIMILIYQL